MDVEECREKLRFAEQKLLDYYSSFYFSENSPLFQVPLKTWKAPSISKEDIQLLEERGFIERVPNKEEVVGSVALWCVEEREKHRRRLITEPIDANEQVPLDADKRIKLDSPSFCGLSGECFIRRGSL